MPISISSPPANLHSPGPIGDMTPNTVGATQIHATGVSTFDAELKTLGFLNVNNRYRFYGGNADGRVWLTNSTASDFDLLQFGKTDATRPALKVSSTKIIFRLADDSADSPAQFSSVTISNIPTSSSGLSSGDVYSNAGILTIVP